MRAQTQDGEQHHLLRDFGLGATISFAFAFISPIVALYGVFAIGLTTTGGVFWWGAPITTAGQLLVALALGQLGSRWPIEGSIYQWSRNLLGRRYGWYAGWVYISALTVAMAAVAYGGGHFLAQLLGLSAGAPTADVALALVMLAAASAGNTIGRTVIKVTVGLCILAEIIGSVGIGFYLLVFHHPNGLGVLLSQVPPTQSGFFNTPLALAVAYAGWSFLGFEAAGAIAEEVKEPARAVPKAMVASLVSVASLVMLASLGLVLAIPDMPAVLAGKSADPVLDTLSSYLPPAAVELVLVTFVVAFFASLTSIQASASRIIWAFARERELPAARFLNRLSGRGRVPANAILVTAALAATLCLLSATHLYQWLVSFTAAGFYLAFAFPVLGACIARLRGRWQPGPVSLGAFGGVVTFAALAWIAFETVDIAWPRLPDANAAWYEAWIIPIVSVIILVAGGLVRLFLGLDRQPALAATPTES
ncbi:MAG TPA: amino acid permease [Stellaceae bacterium]|nr:amino acid permease [Stellaceae bacterium]